MPTKTITDYLYNVIIHFIYLEERDNAYAFVKGKGDYCTKEHFEDCFKKAAGFVIWADEQNICLVLTHHHGEATINTMAHEIFHVVDKIFSDKGLRLTESSSEAYAYYIGWLIGQLCDFCKNAETEVESKLKKEVSKLEKKLSKLKRAKLMKSKASKKAVSKAEFKKYIAKDKKDDMKMIKSTMKKGKRK